MIERQITAFTAGRYSSPLADFSGADSVDYSPMRMFLLRTISDSWIKSTGEAAVTYQVASVDELQDIDYRQDTHMRPVRHRFGITAFGTNAWTAANVGDRLMPEHEEDEGSEELYSCFAATLDSRSTETPLTHRRERWCSSRRW